ncbi:MAG: winged helix-turn-helix transcriptional regulator [Candidatus Paceibacterota bacterium]
MDFVFVIIGLVLVLFVILFLYALREAREYHTSTKDEFVGICHSAIETASVKEARKHKIRSLLKERGELSNSEIREEIAVARRTMVRYLNELEKEGIVKQVGLSGRHVVYRLV